MNLQLIVHTALDELRMQMLGTQVLFGFQLQGVFQERFASASPIMRTTHAAALCLIVLTIGLLLACPSQHRLVEQGKATERILKAANRFAELALGTYALALGLDVYVIAEPYWGAGYAFTAGFSTIFVAVALWHGLGLLLRQPGDKSRENHVMPKSAEPELHEKIDQMLTEARVILPGAQALFGFQFVATLSKAFNSLPQAVQAVHFLSLAAIALSIMLLIAPAAVHRVTFAGRDAERMHDIGSWLVTLALVPLAAGISGDMYVALSKVFENGPPLPAAIVTFVVLITLWYAIPFGLKLSRRRPQG
jgi:hypothetical protein